LGRSEAEEQIRTAQARLDEMDKAALMASTGSGGTPFVPQGVPPNASESANYSI
jgi:hypothetical protein